MGSLVGKFLIGELATSYQEGKRMRWRGMWILHRASSGNGLDWEVIDQGEALGPFWSPKDAVDAAHKIAVNFARVRQGNMELVDTPYPVPSLFER